MRVLKAFLILVPLLILGIILAVGYLDNTAVKKNLQAYAHKKGVPASIENLDLSLTKGQAVFQNIFLTAVDSGFTARVSRLELTVDEQELMKGRRSAIISATNAVVNVPCDIIAALFRGKANVPLAEGGSILNYSAEKVEAGKIPWLMSGEQKSKEPLYITAAEIKGGRVVFQGRTKPLVWMIEELSGQGLAVPADKATDPKAGWRATLLGYPGARFEGEISRPENGSLRTIAFSLVDFPAEVIPELLPEDAGSWQCKGGLLNASGQISFQDKQILPGTVKINLRDLTVNTTQGPELSASKKVKAQIPALSLENANLDLEVQVDDTPPYFHLQEAWENQKTKIQSGRFEMMLDLKF